MTPTSGSQPAARPKRILSQRAIEANRRNSQRSTGPKTEAGKAKSRLNAGRHKITAQVTILPDEERVAAEEFCGKLAATLNPEGIEEIQLARAVAEGYWRLNQARAAITNRFALSLSGTPPHPTAGGHPEIEYALAVADTFEREANTLRLISLYEQRTMNLILRQKRELEAMQKAREEKRKSALNDSAALYRHTVAQGQTWKPEAEAARNGGFLFSPSVLDETIRRRSQLQAAHLAEFGLGPRPTSGPNRNPPSEFRSAARRAA
jgi:hypothetical protein